MRSGAVRTARLAHNQKVIGSNPIPAPNLGISAQTIGNTMYDNAIEAVIASASDSSVYIGCDSVRFKKAGRWYARYATVIVVHHSTRHGASIYHYLDTQPDFGNIKLRLLNEAMYATNAALEIIDWLDGRTLEIHLDINPNPKHKSNVALKEALGYVLGNTGVTAKCKPEAWAASHASDHCARQKPLRR